MDRIFLIGAPLLLAAVVATAQTLPSHDGELAIGQVEYLNGPRVRPLRVIEDSRCPANARCVHAGRVVVQTAVTTGKGKQKLNLVLGERVPVADGTLALVSVTPEKYTNRTPALRDYRFVYDFQGGI